MTLAALERRPRGRTIAIGLGVLLCAASASVMLAQSRRTLDLYVIDVEGGNAQLYVTPSGESVLIDTGNGGTAAVRDAERIAAAVKAAGLTRIDHLITTHFHGDHVGGVLEVAARVPIGEFIDHGSNVQPGAQIDSLMQQYAQLYAKARHTVARPGDRVAVSGLEWRIVSAGGKVITSPLPGAGARNPFCAGFKKHDVNPVSNTPVGNTEDEQSVGSHITFGKFRLLYMGDFTWNQEFELNCPVNRIGTVDLLIASRHGQPSSNSEVLVHAVAPRVIVMNDGPRKGGQPSAMKILLGSPRLEDLWQVHFSELGGQEYTVPGMFISNVVDNQTPGMPIAPLAAPERGAPASPAPAHNGPAYWIKISVETDGRFTVANLRNGFSKTYRPAQ